MNRSHGMSFKWWAYLILSGYPVYKLITDFSITQIAFVLTLIVIITGHYSVWELWLKYKIEDNKPKVKNVK